MSRHVLRVALGLIVLLMSAQEARAAFFLSGQAVTEAGAPVEGASITITKSRSGYEQGLRWLDGEPEPEVLAVGMTDETGWYRLEVPRPGVWRVAVEAPGYVPMERRPEAYLGDERLATVTLWRDVKLPVTVTSAGEPLPEARVWAASSEGRAGPWASLDWREWRPSWPGRFTDEEGRATLPRAPQERLRVVAWKPGHVQVEQAEVTTGPLTLELGPAKGTVGVHVVDARGKPVREALIRVGESPSWSAGVTGEEGFWELPLPGLEELTLRADAGDGRWITETFEGLPEEGPLVLELPQPTVFSGRVSDAETGASLGGALVFRDRSGWYAETGDDGRYRLAFSEPGEMESVQAVAPGHRLSTARVPLPLLDDLSFSLEPVSTLRGRVVTRSGAPIAGATVRLLRHPSMLRFGLDRSRGNSSQGSVTDPEGRFLIIQVPDSPDLQLLAQAEGFAPTIEPVLTAPEAEIELVLGPGSTLEGRVVDGDGEPVIGARIRLFPEVRMGGRRISGRRLSGAGRESDFDVITSDEGRFRLSRLPSGSFTLQADAEGLVSRVLPGIEIPEDEETVELGDVALERGVVLEGFVTDAQGRPLENARVTVLEGGRGARLPWRAMGRSGAVSEMLTEADGRFRFDDLRADTVYSVGAVREGFVPDAKVTEVPAPEPLELVLGTGGRLFGRVTTPSGEPLARGMVRTELAPDPEAPMPYGPRPGQHERLGEDGTFSFDALAPGSVRVHVFDDEGTGSEHGPFEVTSGGDVGPVELVHEGGVLLEGRVLRADGEPAAGTRVSWTSNLPGVGGSSVTADATGRFRFHGVKPGPATVSARDPELGQASQEVDLHPGRQQVELVLGPGLRVAGRVVAPDGQPVTRGQVRVHPMVDTPSPAQMRALLRSITNLEPDGSFAIPVDEPGAYGLWVEAPGFMPYATSSDDLLQVGPGPVEGLVIRLERGGRIVGRISGLDEGELSHVQVRAQRAGSPPESREGVVDYRGRYEIDSVDAGTWAVTARTDQPPRQVTRQVTVAETGGETRLDLTFPESELTLRGQVLLDGEPVFGAMVSARSLAEPQAPPVSSRTDSFGRFRLAGLVPGRYFVQALQSTLHRGVILRTQRDMELVADQEIVLDLERVEPETE